MADVQKYIGKIYILEESRAYLKEVTRYLDLIGSTRSGKALYKAIEANSYWLLILPFKPTKDDLVNAYAYPKDSTGARPVGSIKMLKLTLPGGAVFEIPIPNGTGAGTHTYVDYHPASWTERARRRKQIDPGTGAAEVLYHEMLHALRMKNGLLSDDKIPGYPAMDDIEEFYSILAANVYRSERGFTEFRTDHHGFVKLDKLLKNSENYYDEFKGPIDRWFKEQKNFCLDMAKIDAKFNPFREAAIQLGLMARPGVSMSLPPAHR